MRATVDQRLGLVHETILPHTDVGHSQPNEHGGATAILPDELDKLGAVPQCKLKT